MKKAIILAAGVGKRLGELTKEIPKCLLPIDDNNVLIDFSLGALKDIGVKEIVFVTGFANSILERYINNKWLSFFSVKYLFNNKFNEYNNAYSAYLAKNFFDDETILLNSDIIFHPCTLANLKSKAKTQLSYLVIDDKKGLNNEDMKVKINSRGEITQISKNLSVEDSFGEYIGITYLRALERVKFLKSIEKVVTDKKFDLYYEDALDLILKEISVFPLPTEQKLWTEVDTKEDYEIAKKIAKEIKRIPIL